MDRRPAQRRDAGREGHRLRRLRRLRRRLGSAERLRADVRRHRRGRRQGPARPRRAQARRGRLRPRGQEARRRPLRQDGPQRHRVRHDAELRRGLGAAREGRPGRQRHRGLRLLALRHRDPLLAARPAGRGGRGGPAPRQDRRLRRGLRRGPVDRRGRDRARRTDERHRRLALRALHLPPGRQPGDEGDRRDAQPVRRARRPHRAAGRRRRQPRRRDPPPPCTSRTSRSTTSAPTPPPTSSSSPGSRRSSAATARARPTWSRRSTTSRGSPRTGSSADAPLVRAGAEQAVVRAAVVRDGRTAVLEVEINPGRSNRARVNRSPLPRARELVGLVRTVVFSPEDLTLVKGDPSDRRRFLDDLLVLRTPRLAGVRVRLRPDPQAAQLAAQDRRRRAPRDSSARRARSRPSASGTTTWPGTGAELLAERLALVDALRPYVGKAYETVARGATRDDADIEYRPSFDLEGRTDQRRPRPRRCSPRSSAAATTSSTAASRWSGRTATSCCSASGTARARTGCRSRATPRTGSPGRSRWRCGWRRTTCCAPTATTRS